MIITGGGVFLLFSPPILAFEGIFFAHMAYDRVEHAHCSSIFIEFCQLALYLYDDDDDDDGSTLADARRVKGEKRPWVAVNTPAEIQTPGHPPAGRQSTAR